jgi:hypothetical protein
MADLPADYPDLESKRRRYDRVYKEIADLDDGILLADDFEEALIGIAYPFARGPVALYDYDEAIKMLIARADKVDDPEWDPYEGAVEYLEFNVLGAWVGDKTPIFAALFPEVSELSVSAGQSPDPDTDVDDETK